MADFCELGNEFSGSAEKLRNS